VTVRHEGPSPERVAAVMASVDVWWAIAGGWALDLWLGRVTRGHHDVEVVVRRRDQAVVREGLAQDWRLRCIDPPGSGWRALPSDHVVEPPAFQLRAARDDVEFDLFLEDVDAGVWSYRRDRRVRRPVDEIVVAAPGGLPVVRPEVQLLSLARHAESKHEHDLENVLHELDASARDWLVDALRLTDRDHHWIDRISLTP